MQCRLPRSWGHTVLYRVTRGSSVTCCSVSSKSTTLLWPGTRCRLSNGPVDHGSLCLSLSTLALRSSGPIHLGPFGARCKGTPPRKAPARGIAVSSRLSRARIRIDSAAANNLVIAFQPTNWPSQEHVCLDQRIHLSSHRLETSQQNVESCVIIPDSSPG